MERKILNYILLECAKIGNFISFIVWYQLTTSTVINSTLYFIVGTPVSCWSAPSSVVWQIHTVNTGRLICLSFLVFPFLSHTHTNSVLQFQKHPTTWAVCCWCVLQKSHRFSFSATNSSKVELIFFWEALSCVWKQWTKPCSFETYINWNEMTNKCINCLFNSCQSNSVTCMRT